MKLLLFTVALDLTLSAAAQVPDRLPTSSPALLGGTKAGAQFGTSLAVDGAYTVVGAPLEVSRGKSSGVVHVFDSTTGALLFVIPNPGPPSYGGFGDSVAISGTRVVGGAVAGGLLDE